MKVMIPEFVSNNSKFERLDAQLKNTMERGEAAVFPR
jgi:hypothetical protein